MGVGEVDGPPKKKLKQAQLPFCINSAEKSSNKRKLNVESPESGLALKVSRKDSATPRALAFNKENVKVNKVGKITETVVDLSSDKEENEISKPTNLTVVKESATKCVDGKTTGQADSKENNEGKDLASKLAEHEKPVANEDDVCVELSTTEGEEVKEIQVAEKVLEHKEAVSQDHKVVERSEVVDESKLAKEPGPKKEIQVAEKVLEHKEAVSQDHKIVERSELVDESKLAKEPGPKKESSDANVPIEELHLSNEGGNGSKSTPTSKETNTQNRSCDSAPDGSLAEAKLDQSVESDQGDPDSSVVVSSEDEHNVSSSSSKKGSATTPKHKKDLNRLKLREEKIRLKKEKQELKRLKQEEKERKKQEDLKVKKEEKKKKEDERKQREEAKEEERRRKEEDRKKKEEDRKKKEEDRKKKEEDRKKKEEAKEEEKRKKEEEKKKKEESKEEDRKKKEEARLAEEKKEKLASMALLKFLIPKESKSSTPKKEEVDEPVESMETPKFMPFQVKGDMRLAVQVRHSISAGDKKVLSDALESSSSPKKLYLDEIKEGSRKPYTCPATWPLSEEEHDVIIVESIVEEKTGHKDEDVLCVKPKRQRAKLLQFHDNRRPPYWGTWRKKSSAITPRKPFGQDKVLDYEVDSDSEWEDEEEGEDIDKEGESDKEQSDDDNVGEDGYLLDNTFVPHGYLSDEEAAEEEENLNPEDQKLKLKVLKQEFEQELKTKTRLKPRLLGCVWISNETTEVSKGSLYETLMNFRCKWDESEGPIDPSGPAIVDCTPSPSLASAKFPSTLIEQLVRLVHGSRLSHINLVTEFMNSLDKEKQLSSISKRAVALKIKEIAHKTPSAMGRAVWTVSPELCAEYNLPNLEPPSIPSPVNPVLDTPPPKPKETALVNFLKKVPTPSEPRRRVTPTLVSPIVDLTSSEKPPVAPNPGNAEAQSDVSKTGTSLMLSDAHKTGSATETHGTTKTGPPPATPPVRKRIQPITLSKTVSSSTKTPTTPKLAPIFRNPTVDTPRPPSVRTVSQKTVVDLCDDSTSN